MLPQRYSDKYAAFESALPLMAVGKNFVVSHSGPARAMSEADIAARTGDAVENFTWTDLTEHDRRQAKIVDEQLRAVDRDGGFYVAGHRPTGARKVRQQGRFFQVNSDTKLHFLVLEPGRDIVPKTDLRTVR